MVHEIKIMRRWAMGEWDRERKSQSNLVVCNISTYIIDNWFDSDMIWWFSEQRRYIVIFLDFNSLSMAVVWWLREEEKRSSTLERPSNNVWFEWKRDILLSWDRALVSVIELNLRFQIPYISWSCYQDMRILNCAI